MATYDKLLGHIRYHSIREWLMDGARREDANTIRRAIERLSEDQLERRFAKMLADDKP
jgi:hypothetical protein